jgi:hypothetical protein
MTWNVLSKLKQKQYSSILLITSLLLVFGFYQNCGEGFEVTNQNSVTTPFEVLVAPRDTHAYVGEIVYMRTLIVVPSNGISYQWYKNGILIPNAIFADLVLGNQNNPIGVLESDEALYTLKVNNSAVYNHETAKDVASVYLTIDPIPNSIILPTIQNLSTSRSVRTGETFVLRAAVDGFPKPSLQWYKDGDAILGANLDYLKVDNVSALNEGRYYLEASNARNVAGVQSGGVKNGDPILVIVDRDASAPELVEITGVQKLASGNPIVLKANFIGIPTPTFQWHKNGVAISGATRSSLIIPAANSGNSGIYEIRATNTGGSAISTVEVTVIDGVKILSPIVGGLVPLGQAVKFTVVVQGEDVTYKWFKNNIVIPNQITQELDLGVTEAIDSGLYRVEITNFAGTVQSEATLTVVTPPVIARALANNTVAELASTSFTINVTGLALTYKWFKNNIEIPATNTAQLLLQGATHLDSGNYRVDVSNISGTVSASTTLTVELVTDGIALFNRDCASCHSSGAPPKSILTTMKFNKTAAEIKNAMLNVAGMSAFKSGILTKRTDTQIAAIADALNIVPPTIIRDLVANANYYANERLFLSADSAGKLLSFQWYKNGAPTNSPSMIIGLANGWNSSLRIDNINVNDSGAYFLRVSNPAGSVDTSVRNIIVNPSQDIIITKNLEPKSFTTGESFKLSAEYTSNAIKNGEREDVGYVWSKNGFIFESGRNTNGKIELNFLNADSTHAGFYQLHIRTNGGNVILFNTVLVTLPTQSNQGPSSTAGGPAINVGLSNVSAKVGQNVILNATTDESIFFMRWFKDGLLISDSELVNYTNLSFQINNIQLNQAGKYTLFIRNELGTNLSSAIVTVNP